MAKGSLSAPNGAEQMNDCSTIFAYFAPEAQLPLASLIGAISGIVLIVGAAPIRVVTQWIRRR
jgi:hypothetical protein